MKEFTIALLTSAALPGCGYYSAGGFDWKANRIEATPRVYCIAALAEDGPACEAARWMNRRKEERL